MPDTHFKIKTGRQIALEVSLWVIVYLFFLWIFRTQEFWSQHIIAIECIFWLYLVTALNSRRFVPNLLMKGKRVSYILLVFVILFLSLYFARKFLLTELNGYSYVNIKSPSSSLATKKGLHLTVFELATTASLLGSTIIKVYKKNRESQEKITQIGFEKKNAELKLLRTQFNPHFLLNALNNLYSVELITPEKSTQHIERLISLMKYLTYDLKNDKIELRKELEFIDDYIFFQIEKDTERFQVEKNSSIIDKHCEIEPRVLIPFVENAFKHSYHPEKVAKIEISSKQKNRDFEFTIKNNKSDFVRSKLEQGYFGLGIETTIQILQSVYGPDFQIEFTDQLETYSVSLTLKNIF